MSCSIVSSIEFSCSLYTCILNHIITRFTCVLAWKVVKLSRHMREIERNQGNEFILSFERREVSYRIVLRNICEAFTIFENLRNPPNLVFCSRLLVSSMKKIQALLLHANGTLYYVQNSKLLEWFLARYTTSYFILSSEHSFIRTPTVFS